MNKINTQNKIDTPAPSSQVFGDQISGARDYQEDSFQIIELAEINEYLLILTDGMGGHVGGARASQLVVNTFASHFKKADGDIAVRLRRSLDASNMAIADEIKENPDYTGMGCTLLVCLISDNALHWLSVGDSPLWLFRKNQMIRLNADHSMRPVLESLLKSGEISDEEFKTDSRINQLRSVVMGEHIRMVDQNKTTHTLNAGDQIILASDGLETLTVDEIGTVCKKHNSPTATVAALLKEIKARQHAGQDNTTAVIYKHPEAAQQTKSEKDWCGQILKKLKVFGGLK